MLQNQLSIFCQLITRCALLLLITTSTVVKAEEPAQTVKPEQDAQIVASEQTVKPVQIKSSTIDVTNHPVAQAAQATQATQATQQSLPVTEVEQPVSPELLHAQATLKAALPATITPVYFADLSKLYYQNAMKLMWTNTQAQAEFRQQLAELALSGVQPQFITWSEWLSDPKLSELGRDIILSDAMLGYLQFIEGLTEKGNIWLYRKTNYKLELPTETIVSEWQNALKNEQLTAFVSSLAPQHPQYKMMREVMLDFLADSQPWPVLKLTKTLRVGEKVSSTEIEALTEILTRTAYIKAQREALIEGNIIMLPTTITPQAATSTTASTETDSATAQLGVNITATIVAADVKTADKTKVDNKQNTAVKQPAVKAKPTLAIYSKELVEKVKMFQRWLSLSDDGNIGKQTLVALNVTPQQRATQLALNIQRLRLLPVKTETAIMVNIPDYTLHYYIGGKEVLFSRVIVGRTDRKTPIMTNAINSVVVNPPWNVPPKLGKEDIIPKLKNDPTYLERLGYSVYSGWGNDSQELDPTTIDWANVSAKKMTYRFKQSPGGANSLGRYKFNIPNADAIYLHDTPNHRLFKNNARAISSGCIRVNKADELANMLLTDTGWDKTKINSTLKGGKTTSVKLGDQIPVYLYYMTAWISDDQQLQFRADIYDHDQISQRALKSLPQIKMLLH